MANLFGILAILLLGFSAFLTWKNKTGYELLIDDTKQAQLEKVELQNDLKEAQAKLKETEEEIKSLEGKKVEVDADLITQTQAADDMESEIEDYKLEINEKRAELAETEEAMKEFGDADEAIANFKALKEDIGALENQLVVSNSKRNVTETSLEKTQSSTDALRDKISLYSKGTSSPGLNTNISRVYDSLGFVTISGGDNLGIIKNSTLNVERGGEVIAKLLVTTVELNRAAANIIPDSVQTGVSLRSGDKVVANLN